MPFTNAQKAAILDFYYGGTTIVPPATLYIGLSTTTPSATGSNFTEPSGAAGYARVEIDNDTYGWNSATVANPSVKSNAVELEFPEATSSWGTLTYFGIFADSETPTPIDYAIITTPKSVTVGDVIRFKVGELKTTLSIPIE